MSTLRISNIEAKADNSSPTVDEQLKFTNSTGDLMLYLDGRTSGITTVGINTTNQTIKFDANNNVMVTGIVTATEFHGTLAVGTSVTYGDNEKAYFGNGLDLQIFHDASGGHSRIDDTGTGGLVLRGSNILLEKYGGGYLANFKPDDSVDLFYAGNKKFETTNTGAVVTGILTATTFSGSIAASNINSGTVATARLGSGTANNSSFLRGDQTWAAVTSTTINNNANNRLITGSGTANTLEGESSLTYDGTMLFCTGGTITAERGAIPSVEAKNSTDTSYARFYCSQTSGSGGYAAFQKLGTNSSAIGGANATQIWCTGDAPLVIGVNNGERLRIDSAGRILVKETTNSTGAYGQYATLQLKGNSTNTNASIFVLANGKNTTANSSGDHLGYIVFGDKQAGEYAYIRGTIDGGPAVGDYPGKITFNTTADGAGSATERMTIRADGKVGINQISPQRILHIGTSGTAEANIRLQGGSDYGEIRVKDSDNNLSFHHNVGGAGSRELFNSNGSTGHFSINCYTYQGLTITTNENGANGPEIQLMHNSASPAANDVVGQLRYSGKDSAGNTTLYSKIQTVVDDPTNGQETGHIDFSTRGLAAYNSIFRLKARGSASAPSYTTDDMNGIILDTYNTGNPYPRYFNFIAKSAGNTDSNITFWTEKVGGSPTEKLRIAANGVATFSGNVTVGYDTTYSPIQQAAKTWYYTRADQAGSVSGSNIQNLATSSIKVNETIPISNMSRQSDAGAHSIYNSSSTSGSVSRDMSSANPFHPKAHGLTMGTLFRAHTSGNNGSGVIHYGANSTNEHFYIRYKYSSVGLNIGCDTNGSDVWTTMYQNDLVSDNNWYFVVIAVERNGTLLTSLNGAPLTPIRMLGGAPSPGNARFGLAGDPYSDNDSRHRYATAWWYKGVISNELIAQEYAWLKTIWTGASLP